VTKGGHCIRWINEKYTQNSGQETCRKRPLWYQLMRPLKKPVALSSGHCYQSSGLMEKGPFLEKLSNC
jgi:hypothetical protein